MGNGRRLLDANKTDSPGHQRCARRGEETWVYGRAPPLPALRHPDQDGGQGGAGRAGLTSGARTASPEPQRRAPAASSGRATGRDCGGRAASGAGRAARDQRRASGRRRTQPTMAIAASADEKGEPGKAENRWAVRIVPDSHTDWEPALAGIPCHTGPARTAVGSSSGWSARRAARWRA